MDITQEQKKIFVITASALLLFIAFWLLIYFPAKNSVKVLKAEVFKMEGDKAIVAVAAVPKGAEETCKKAVEECPVTAIVIV